MANWASTSYRIEGSERELRKIFNVIEDFITGKNEPVEKNASREWEGNIVKALGATKEQMESITSVALYMSTNLKITF